MLIDPDRFERVLVAWARSALAPGEPEPDQPRQVVIDGRVLRRSSDRGRGWHPLRLVSAYTTERAITLGQSAVLAGAGELAAVPGLLDGLEPAGCLVTLEPASARRRSSAGSAPERRPPGPPQRQLDPVFLGRTEVARL